MSMENENSIKVYTYGRSKLLSSYGVAILLAIVLIVCLFQWLTAPDDKTLQKMLIFIPLVLAAEFFTLNEPTKITDDGEYITFYAFSRKHAYKWDEMSQLRIKRFAMSDRVLVQIGNKALSGRYWISTGTISDGPELLEKLLLHESKYKCIKKKNNLVSDKG